MWITFYMDFVLLFCERGLYECEFVSRAGLLFNRIKGMLCGCEFTFGYGFVLEGKN